MYIVVVESKSMFGYGVKYNYLYEVSELGELYSSYKDDALKLSKEEAEEYSSKINRSKIIEISKE